MKSVLLGILAIATTAAAGEWKQWRGPELNGTCNATDLPVEWSLESGKNIAWDCTLPGTGSSTPILVDGRLYLTAQNDQSDMLALCIEAASGKILWKKNVGEGRNAGRGNLMASPSAVSDGKTVCFLFGQGTLVSFSLDGKKLWKRELLKDHGSLDCKFGFSSSPLLMEGKLYIPLLYLPVKKQHVDLAGQHVMALSAATGKTLWCVERPSEAISESLDAYITPVAGKNGIIITGADLVTCHHPDTGKEEWRFSLVDKKRSKMWRIISSPVQAGDLSVTAYPRGRDLVALDAEGQTAWTYKGYVPDVCTPAYHDGTLYVLDGMKRYLTTLNAKDGQEILKEKIPSDKGFFASPLIADNKAYMINLNGEVFIYSLGKKAELISRIPMEAADSSASIIAENKTLYIRLPGSLICVKETK